MKWLTVFLLVGMMGCAKPAPQTEPRPQSWSVDLPDPYANDPQWEKNLRAAAKLKHLHWRIFCSGLESPDRGREFLAFAIPPDGSNDPYIEDGGTPTWSSHGTTQEECGKRLLRAIMGPPNEIPVHKPKEDKKECVKDIGSDEGEQ